MGKCVPLYMCDIKYGLTVTSFLTTEHDIYFKACKGTKGSLGKIIKNEKPKEKEVFWVARHISRECIDSQRNGVCYLLRLSSGNTSSHWLKC